MATHLIPTVGATWTRATKVDGLKAKHMGALLTDNTVVSKFLIDTIEGEEPIEPTNMFCIGVTNDAWQQPPRKLLRKYDVIDVTPDGWLVCVPKPDNRIDYFTLTLEHVSKFVDARMGDTFVIQGIYGKTMPGLGENMQELVIGDAICRQVNEFTDQWVVEKSLFARSYKDVTT
jgi:hypothetical protein